MVKETFKKKILELLESGITDTKELMLKSGAIKKTADYYKWRYKKDKAFFNKVEKIKNRQAE